MTAPLHTRAQRLFADTDVVLKEVVESSVKKGPTMQEQKTRRRKGSRGRERDCWSEQMASMFSGDGVSLKLVNREGRCVNVFAFVP